MDERAVGFWKHVGELRNRLLRTGLVLIVTVCGAFYFRVSLVDFLRWPLPADYRLYYFGVTEAFLFYFKVALLAGLVAASPYLLFELYAFFAPALKREEKRLLFPMLPAVILLFAAGISFVFFVLLPYSIRFLLGFGGEQLTSVLQADRYFGFVLGLSIGGGLTFELPVVLAVFAKLGWVTARGLWRSFRYAIILILIATAILTPTPDALPMLLLSAPVIFLYVLSIAVVSRIRPLAHNDAA